MNLIISDSVQIIKEYERLVKDQRKRGEDNDLRITSRYEQTKVLHHRLKWKPITQYHG